MSSILKECLLLLGNNGAALQSNETKKISELFEHEVPLTNWGKVDWEQINKKIIVESPEDIIPALNKLLKKSVFDTSVYVLWDEASLPVIKTDLNSILKCFDVIVAVSFETWFFNPYEGYVIEVPTSGVISAGLIKEKNEKS